MTVRPWSQILERAIRAFDGQLPGQQLETMVAAFYADHPELVIATIAEVAGKFKDGKISSPWGIVRHEINKRKDTPAAVNAYNDRELARQRSEQWMKTIGCQFPTWAEVVDELTRGTECAWLRTHPDLEQDLKDLYDQLNTSEEAAA